MSKKSARKKSCDKLDKPEIICTDEEPSHVQKCLQTLRQLLKDEKNLKVKADDDMYLLRFLRWVDMDPEMAFIKMKAVYKFRAEYKDWFCKKPPSEMEATLSKNIATVLHDRDSRGRRVYLIKLGRVDTRDVSIFDYTHCDDLWMESILMEEETQKNGLAVILDMAGYSWKLFSWLTPNNNRIGAGKLDCLTLRNYEVHVVNTSFLLNASIALVYPFLDAKVKERIHFHSQDWPSLHKHINPEILPEEYGGKLSSLDYDKLRSLMYSRSDKIMEMLSLGYTDP